MRSLNIGIRMCGGCNPIIDRADILLRITAYFESKGYRILVNEKTADYLICISGCSASCADDNGDEEMIKTVIAGESVDAIVVKEEFLCEEVIRKEGLIQWIDG